MNLGVQRSPGNGLGRGGRDAEEREGKGKRREERIGKGRENEGRGVKGEQGEEGRGSIPEPLFHLKPWFVHAGCRTTTQRNATH